MFKKKKKKTSKNMFYFVKKLEKKIENKNIKIALIFKEFALEVQVSGGTSGEQMLGKQVNLLPAVLGVLTEEQNEKGGL